LSSNDRKLIYIVGTYPLLTTTFIDREIARLREVGIEIQVVSIRRPPADLPLSEAQRRLQKGVRYLLPASFLGLVWAHLRFAAERPRPFFGSLAYLLTRPHPSVRARFKTLLHFGEAVYAAYLVRGMSFREFHAHFADRAATLALVMGRLVGKPYSLSVHAAEDIYVHPTLLDEKISEARHTVTCTAYNKAHLERLLGRCLDSRVTVIPHGLPTEEYHPRSVKPPGPPRILAVGQLVARKGFLVLIDACRILKDRGILFQAQIVGAGPLAAVLERRIEKLELEDQVTLIGALPHAEVIECYAEASMLVMPCIQSEDGNMDGIPNVLLEAMAMQLPVISTRISAVPELIVDGENGLLVEAGDPRGLAEAMERLIASRGAAEEMGRSGRELVIREFDVCANVRQFGGTLWPEWFPTLEAGGGGEEIS
jgi:colanic acid/amylovoran biosynthesis glycosyltransferase